MGQRNTWLVVMSNNETSNSQKAGRGSNQLSAGGNITLVVNKFELSKEQSETLFGITKNQSSYLSQIFSGKALMKAFKKTKKMDEKLVERLHEEGMLGELDEPVLQKDLHEVTNANVMTDEAGAEDFLIDLIIQKSKNKDNQMLKIATDKAIQAAQNLTSSTLNSLTSIWATTNLEYIAEDEPILQKSALSQIESVISPFINGDLLDKGGWVRSMEDIGLVSINNDTYQRTEYKIYISNKYKALLTKGFVAEEVISDQSLDSGSKEILLGFPEHEYKPGYKFVPFYSLDDLERLVLTGSEETRNNVLNFLKAKDALTEDPQVIENFKLKMEEYPSIKQFAEWYDKVLHFSFTNSGHVVSFINARQYINFTPTTVPEMLNRFE